MMTMSDLAKQRFIVIPDARLLVCSLPAPCDLVVERESRV